MAEYNATIKIDDGSGKIVEFPVSSYKDQSALRFSVECMLHLYAGAAETTKSIHTETTYADGITEKRDYLCYKGRLIADSVMTALLNRKTTI